MNASSRSVDDAGGCGLFGAEADQLPDAGLQDRTRFSQGCGREVVVGGQVATTDRVGEVEHVDADVEELDAGEHPTG